MADDQLANEPGETLAVESPKSEAEIATTSLDGPVEVKTETTEAPEETTAETTEAEVSGDQEEQEAEPKQKRLPGSERLKRRLAAIEAENAALRSRSGDGEVSTTELEKRIGAAPKEDQYKGDYLAYERALTAYELDKRQVTREMRGEIEKAKTARSERMRDMVEEHQERVDEFKTKVADFNDVMKAATGLKVAPVVEELLIESDKSAHLQYFLAKNPLTLSRLNDMSEREAAREIGRIEATLSLPNPKTTTSAPKPVIPPKGAAAPKYDPAKSDNMRDYIKWRKAQDE